MSTETEVNNCLFYYIINVCLAFPAILKPLSLRLHSTIRSSIDNNVNSLTPCSKTMHTKFTKPASF